MQGSSLPTACFLLSWKKFNVDVRLIKKKLWELSLLYTLRLGEVIDTGTET